MSTEEDQTHDKRSVYSLLAILLTSLTQAVSMLSIHHGVRPLNKNQQAQYRWAEFVLHTFHFNQKCFKSRTI